MAEWPVCRQGIKQVLLFCLGNWATSHMRARQCGDKKRTDTWAGDQEALPLTARWLDKSSPSLTLCL